MQMHVTHLQMFSFWTFCLLVSEQIFFSYNVFCSQNHNSCDMSSLRGSPAPVLPGFLPLCLDGVKTWSSGLIFLICGRSDSSYCTPKSNYPHDLIFSHDILILATNINMSKFHGNTSNEEGKNAMMQTHRRKFEFNSTIPSNKRWLSKMIFRTYVISKNVLNPKYTFSICIKYGLGIEKLLLQVFLLESGTLQSFVLSEQENP